MCDICEQLENLIACKVTKFLGYEPLISKATIDHLIKIEKSNFVHELFELVENSKESL